MRKFVWRVLDNFLKISQYESVVDRNRASMIYSLLLVVVGIMTAYAFLVPQWLLEDGAYTLIQAILIVQEVGPILIAFLSLYIFGFLSFFFARRGNLEYASWLLLATWCGGGAWLNLLAQNTLDAAGISLILALVLGALLKQRAGLLVSTLFGLISIGVALQIRNEPTFSVGNVPTLVLSMLSVALVLYLFLRFFKLSVTQGVIEAIDERVRASEIITELSGILTERSAPEVLAQEMARLLGEKFDHVYQARVYLLDDSGSEVYVAGKIVKQNRQGLPVQLTDRTSVGGLTSIGQVAGSGKPLVLYPTERAVEIILPMRLGKITIGVLSLHSNRVSYFTDINVLDAFQSMADSLVLALDSTRQFERAEARLRENARLMEQMQANTREIDRLNENLTGSAWSQFLRSGHVQTGLDIDFRADKPAPQPANDWTQTLTDAMLINQLAQDMDETKQIVAVPLRVRGQVIGAMEFELDINHRFTSEDYDLVQEVSERFGLAVENNRLVQESQRVARREMFLNELSTKLQGTNDVQSALSAAAQDLLEALNAGRVAIKLGRPTDSPANGANASNNGGKSE